MHSTVLRPPLGMAVIRRPLMAVPHTVTIKLHTLNYSIIKNIYFSSSELTPYHEKSGTLQQLILTKTFINNVPEY